MSAEIDPSLCAAEPAPDSLADGFSPPPEEASAEAAAEPQSPPELGAQSPF